MTSTWGLKQGVTGEYYAAVYEGYTDKEWTGVSSEYVSLTTPNPSMTLYSYSLDDVNYIDASYTSSTVTLESEVEVGTYLVIGIDPLQYEVLVATTVVNTTDTWGTSYIPY